MLPLLLAASLSFAQDGIDAHGTFPAPLDGDARDPILLTRPGRMTAGQAYASALLEVINAPLVLVSDDGTDVTRTPALDDVVGVNVMGGYAVHERVRLDLLVPAFLASQSLGDGQGARLGDLRAAAMLAIVRPGPVVKNQPDRLEAGVGLAPWVTVPTGDAEAFLGAGGPTGGVQVNGTLEAGRFVATGLVGPRFVPQTDALNLQGADSFDLGLSAGLLASERTGVHLESMTRSPLEANDVPWRGAPSELVASLRHRTSKGFNVVLGGGGSLTPAVGSPGWRLMVGGGWGQVDDGGDDPDLDGMVIDDCPDEPETVNGYLDEDGCPDRLADLEVNATYQDAAYPEADIELQLGPSGPDAPTPPAEAYDFAPVRLYGRMPDEHWDARGQLACMTGSADLVLVSGENILDIPLVPILDSDVTFLVVDTDDKLIENATVQWVAGPTGCAPLEVLELPLGKGEATIGEGEFEVAGTAAGYETRLVKLSAEPGQTQEVRIQLAPSRLELDGDEIRILEKVHFETNSHVIKPVSYSLLAEVAATIVAHPEFGQVEVAGHADERGPDAYNLELSARRAASVRDHLAKEGVTGSRLTVKGYGEEQPLVDESSEAAWSENRRVQFSILGRAPVDRLEEVPR